MLAEQALPQQIAKLPVNKAGYRVPWFAAQTGPGEWDFRVIRARGVELAHGSRLCWICGGPMSAFKTFVIGPMCVVNRVSSEPPMHRDCALYSVVACPFLTRPNMRRRTTGLDDSLDAPGYMVERNPGAQAVWTTKKYTTKRASHGGSGLLFEIGEPTDIRWVREGRTATREEIMESMESGYPILLEMAERDGPMAVRDMQAQWEVALELVPSG